MRAAGHRLFSPDLARSIGLATVILLQLASEVAGFGAHAAERQAGVGGQARRAEQAARLAQQIQALARLSPIEPRAAVVALGSKLGRQKNPTPYRAEWSIRPTALVAEGDAVRFPDGYYLQIVPRPSLGLSLQDLEPILLDLPYVMDYRREHAGVDSIAVVVAAINHVFRVKGGELHVVVPTSEPREAGDQNRRAIDRGLDVAEGNLPGPSRISEIFITTRIRQDWHERPTLRQLRQRR